MDDDVEVEDDEDDVVVVDVDDEAFDSVARPWEI